jgi:hypothetical protein
MTIWYNTWPFGLVCAHSVYFYRFSKLGPRKIRQPWCTYIIYYNFFYCFYICTLQKKFNNEIMRDGRSQRQHRLFSKLARVRIVPGVNVMNPLRPDICFFHFTASRFIHSSLLKLFFKKGCPGWGANPGYFASVYFLFPSLYRWATAAPQLVEIIAVPKSDPKWSLNNFSFLNSQFNLAQPFIGRILRWVD